jgi:hypothetical protein
MRNLALFGASSSGLTLALDLFLVLVAVVYLALLYWTYADAKRRFSDPGLVVAVSAVGLLPFIGPFIYLLLRPAETLQEAYERELEVEAARLRLQTLESRVCPHCDHPIELDFLRCPACQRKLREPCGRCGRPIDLGWPVCPYCEARAGAPPRRSAERHGVDTSGPASRRSGSSAHRAARRIENE